MLQFKDFFPMPTKTNLLGSPNRYESLEQVTKTANIWINSNPIKLINVESVLIPLGTPLPKSDEINSQEGRFITAGQAPVHWMQGVRVWYQAI